MADYTSTGTGVWDDVATWGGGGFPVAGDTATEANTHTITLDSDEACTTDTINAGGTLNIAQYALAVSGNVTVDGSLDIGASGGTGLTIGGNLAINSGSSIGLNAASLINVAGDVTIVDADVWDSSYRGILHHTGTGNYTNVNSGNYWRKWYVDVGATVTPTTDSTRTISASDALGECHILGTVDGSGYDGIAVSIAGTGILEWGASCDFTGVSQPQFDLRAGATFTKSKDTFPSFTGEFRFVANVDNQQFGTVNIANGAYSARLSDVTSTTGGTFLSGTLTCQNFYISCNSAARSHQVDCSTNNPSFVVNGDVDFDNSSSGFTLSLLKGTGSRTHGGSTGNLNYYGQSIEDLVINSSGQKTVINNFTTESITITSGELDIGAKTVTSTGAVAINGTFEIGVAGILNAQSTLAINTGSQIRLDTTSVVNAYDDITIHNSAIWASNNRGILTIKESLIIVSIHASNYWDQLIVDVTKTLTCNSCRLTSNASTGATINGSIYAADSSAVLGAKAAGAITIGVNGDFDGAAIGNHRFMIINGATLTNNRTTAFTHPGTIQVYADYSLVPVMPAWDFSNADVLLQCAFDNTVWRFYTGASATGTLKSVDFSIDRRGKITSVTNNVLNPSFEWTGNVDIAYDTVGGGSTTYTTGTGTIKGKTSSGTVTWDFDGKTVEANIYECSGGTINHVAAFTSPKITMTSGTVGLKEGVTTTLTDFEGTGGILQSASAGTQAIVALTNAAIFANVTGVSFKDISMNAASKINAKNSNTNLGNCKGIVFVDAFGDF